MDKYISVPEAAEWLNCPEAAVWRLLESGELPALLRAELYTADGEYIGFDYALLPPEGVKRVVDQGGDDFTLEWRYACSQGKAVCSPARASSIRVLASAWFPKPKHADEQAWTANGTPPKLSAEQQAQIVRLYAYGRGNSVAALARQFQVSRPIVDKVLKKAGVKVQSSKHRSHLGRKIST